MAPHSSTLAWKVLWVEEPGRLQSMGLLRVEHDRATSLSLFTFMHWRRKWQPTPVFLPGESQGWGSLVGCCLWGCTESDTTEATYQTWFLIYNSVEKLIGWIVVLTWHLYALTIEKIHITHFIVTFAVLWWSAIKLTISLRYIKHNYWNGQNSEHWQHQMLTRI